MPVRLSFVEEHSVASELIAWKGSGRFSHVDALRDDGMRWGARSDKVGGVSPGIQLRAPNYAPFKHETVFTFPATELQEQSFWAWWESQQGKPYAVPEIFGYLFNMDLVHEGQYVCSHAGYASLASIELVSQTPYLPGNKIDPTMLAVISSVTKGVTWKDLL